MLDAGLHSDARGDKEAGVDEGVHSREGAAQRGGAVGHKLRCRDSELIVSWLEAILDVLQGRGRTGCPGHLVGPAQEKGA